MQCTFRGSRTASMSLHTGDSGRPSSTQSLTFALLQTITSLDDSIPATRSLSASHGVGSQQRLVHVLLDTSKCDYTSLSSVGIAIRPQTRSQILE